MVFAGALLAGVVALFIYRRLFRSVDVNSVVLVPLLDDPQEKRTFFRSYVSGFYKGRKFVFISPHFDEGPGQNQYLEPLQVPQPQKWFMLSYPRPTENTRLVGRRVYYSPKGFFVPRKSYDRTYTKEEFLGILEELTEAAKKVERSS